MTTIINGTTDAITFPDGTIQTTAATSVFVSGTVVLFGQTAAPTGFTKLTNQDNAALRVVSGTASTGGTVGFTTAFASQAVTITAVSGTAGATTLTTPQIPSHAHSVPGVVTNYGQAARGSQAGGPVNTSYTSGSTGGGGSHDHPFSFTSATATAINLAVKYVDVIRATKD